MPIFEFQCTECGKSFEELVRSANNVDGIVCPECHSTQVRKQISLFASTPGDGASLSSFSSAASCNTGST